MAWLAVDSNNEEWMFGSKPCRNVFADRFYPSSKTCSVCGYKKRDLRLSDREWVCSICGTNHDRDINATVNILIEGKRMLTAE